LALAAARTEGDEVMWANDLAAMAAVTAFAAVMIVWALLKMGPTGF
jgi:hypothetical protein